MTSALVWNDDGVSFAIELEEDQPEFSLRGPVIARVYEERALEMITRLGFEAHLVHQPLDIKATREGKIYWFEVKGGKRNARYWTRRQAKKLLGMMSGGEKVYIVSIKALIEKDEEGVERRILEFEIEPFNTSFIRKMSPFNPSEHLPNE